MEEERVKWQERIAAFRETSEEETSYGDQQCGCTWDSGPYGVYCRAHDPDDLERDILIALIETVERGDRDEDLIEAAMTFVEDSTPGSDR